MRRVYASIVIRRVTKKERRELVANGNGLRSFRSLVSQLSSLCSTCIFRVNGIKNKENENEGRGGARDQFPVTKARRIFTKTTPRVAEWKQLINI